MNRLSNHEAGALVAMNKQVTLRMFLDMVKSSE
jgi:hypothetical protein